MHEVEFTRWIVVYGKSQRCCTRELFLSTTQLWLYEEVCNQSAAAYTIQIYLNSVISQRQRQDWSRNPHAVYHQNDAQFLQSRSLVFFIFFGTSNTKDRLSHLT